MKLEDARIYIDAEHKALYKALGDYYRTKDTLVDTFFKKRKKELTEQLKWDKIAVVSEIEQLFPELVGESLVSDVIYRHNMPNNYFIKRGE